MIDYFKGIYGINLLFRVHGSALYKGSLVGFLSVFVYLAIVLQWNENGRARDDLDDDLDHPYGVGVLVSSVTFLIIFRANYGYQRYWEACVSIECRCYLFICIYFASKHCVAICNLFLPRIFHLIHSHKRLILHKTNTGIHSSLHEQMDGCNNARSSVPLAKQKL